MDTKHSETVVAAATAAAGDLSRAKTVGGTETSNGTTEASTSSVSSPVPTPVPSSSSGASVLSAYSSPLIKDNPGFAHLRLPYNMTYEQEKELLQECRGKVEALLDQNSHSERWTYRTKLKGVQVSTSQDKDGGPFRMTKGVTDMPVGVTLDHVRTQLNYDARNGDAINRLVHRSDPMAKQMTVVTSLQHRNLLRADQHEECRVVWTCMAVAPLVNDRDFVFVQHTLQTTCPVTGETIFVLNAFSIDCPAVPDMYESLGLIRAEIKATGYIFRPISPASANDDHQNDRLSMTYLLQADPRGWLPPSIVNIASISQATNVGRIRDLFQQYMDVAQRMNHTLPPLESFAFTSKGSHVTHPIRVELSNNDHKTAAAGGGGGEEEAVDRVFLVRLCAHAEHTASLRLVLTSADQSGNEPLPYSLSCDDSENNANSSSSGASLCAGKSIEFAGKHAHVWSTTLQLSLTNQFQQQQEEVGSVELVLELTNMGRKKNTVYVPAIIQAVPSPNSDAVLAQ